MIEKLISTRLLKLLIAIEIILSLGIPVYFVSDYLNMRALDFLCRLHFLLLIIIVALSLLLYGHAREKGNKNKKVLIFAIVICIISYGMITINCTGETQIMNQAQFIAQKTGVNNVVCIKTEASKGGITAINITKQMPENNKVYNMVEVLYHHNYFGSNYYVKKFE